MDNFCRAEGTFWLGVQALPEDCLQDTLGYPNFAIWGEHFWKGTMQPTRREMSVCLAWKKSFHFILGLHARTAFQSLSPLVVHIPDRVPLAKTAGSTAETAVHQGFVWVQSQLKSFNFFKKIKNYLFYGMGLLV